MPRSFASMNIILTTENFDVWLTSISDKMTKKRIQARIRRAELDNFGDVSPVGEGVSEMRLHFGPGYRVYFTRRDLEIVILLAGGDKATQEKDIRNALELARQLRGESNMALELRKWDIQEHLKTEEDMALYLQACIEEAGDDAAFIAAALGDIVRARSMSELAKETGLGRESLYKALSGEDNPSFGTILKVTRALGLKLTVSHAA